MDINSPENRKALIRISQFVLEEEAEKLREHVQEKIVETALFWGMKENEFASTGTILELIEKEIPLVKFHDVVLDDVLSRLHVKGSIVENAKGSCRLSVLRRAEFGKLVNKIKEKMDRINGQFLLLLEREYGKKLTDEQKNTGLEKLYSLLASLAYEKSDFVARIITQKNVENLPWEISAHKIYGILGEIQENDLRNAEFRAIKLIFRESSEDFCRFLFSLTQNLVCIQILNLDPECQALERKAFSDKMLFLDTNVMLGLICPTSWQHKLAVHLVTLSKSLGAKCFVTKRTCDEYMKVLEEANRILEKWNAPMKFLQNTSNEFLISFWSEKQNDQSLAWHGYYQRCKDVGKLLSEQEIQLYVESLEKIRRNEHFKTIMAHVNTCYQAVKQKSKSGNVCEHDALLMILIRELRRDQSLALLGSNSWFITLDGSLLCVDNLINSIPEFKDKTPSSMLCDIWLEMISPFLPLSVRKREAFEAFAVLVKHQFSLVPSESHSLPFQRIRRSSVGMYVITISLSGFFFSISSTFL